VRADGKRYLVRSGLVGPYGNEQVVGVGQLMKLYGVPKDQCICVPWDPCGAIAHRILCGLDTDGLIALHPLESGRYREEAEALKKQREREDFLALTIKRLVREKLRDIKKTPPPS
jgi:hypothetical protein